jgi:hypothetical protein
MAPDYILSEDYIPVDYIPLDYFPEYGDAVVEVSLLQEDTLNIPTQFQSLSLPVIVSDPLWQTDRQGYIETLSDELNDYQHSISAYKGFDQCSFSIAGNSSYIDNWLINGLGRHIVTKNESLVVIWEGFVNRISVQIGGESKVIGPLLDMGNSVIGTYSPLDVNTTPPSSGESTTTDLVEDATSRNRYGVIQQILSVGSTTQTIADQAVNKYLYENKFPPTSTDISSDGGDVTLSIECLGYYHLFDTYYYNNLINITDDLDNVLLAIIQAYPQYSTIFSSDTSRFESNSLPIPTYEDSSPRAKSIIEELVPLGDVDLNRYSFMVLADRQIIYEAVVNEIEYLYRIEEQSIEDKQNNRVFPWNIQPGKWLRTPDFLVGRSQPTNLKEDLRNTFIVSVTFTAPDQFQISGDELEELPQLLAKVQRGINIPG